LVEGLVRLMESSYDEPVNIGNPTELTVLQFATLIQRLTKTDRGLAFRPLPGDDPKQRRPDISLAKTVLDWEPRVPVEIGLARTIDAFREELRRRPCLAEWQPQRIPIGADGPDRSFG
jgi:nucleoside-diphosphate-sugar epimerase